MSALGGIYAYAGRPIHPRSLADLGASLAQHGSDGGCEVIADNLGFAFRAFHTNRESRLENQPYVSADGLILLWDGRLDNREELIRVLRGEFRERQSVITDVEIVIAAYRKWREDFLIKLVGDFALSLWNPASRVLSLARDPAGVRPLYYHLNRESITWASDLTVLVESVSGAMDVDEDYVAGFLSLAKDPRRTPFINFNAVRPGHVVSINAEGMVTERRFWRLDPDAEIRMRSDKEYEERFLELFKEAVGSRLRSDRTVVSELSGGLDSSSIVCIAHELIAKGAVQAPTLEMVSYVSDECASSDERKFISYVEDHLGRRSNHIRQEDFPFLTPLLDPSRVSTINPFLTNCAYLSALKELMNTMGARIRLSGVGGDELLHSVNDPAPELAELLTSLKLIALCRRLKVWGKLLREPYGRLFWEKSLLPVLPVRIRSVFKNRGRTRIPQWMNSDFVSRTRLREKNVATPDIFGFRSPIGRDQSIGFLSVVNVLAMGHHAEVCDHEVSFPFLHRPLVEFLCAIPFEQLLRPGESRSLMRRSLVGRLPPKTLNRRGKGDPRELVSVEFVRRWPLYAQWFEDPLVVRYGFAEPKPLREAISRVRHGFIGEASRLVSLITLEMWLRMIEERRMVRQQPGPRLDLIGGMSCEEVTNRQKQSRLTALIQRSSE